MSVAGEILVCILGLLLIVLPASLGFSITCLEFYTYKIRRNKRLHKLEAKESLDQFTHKHSEHWDYIKDIVPWRIRLRLSRFRGKERPLTWRIKLLALFTGMGPQVAEWVLEEYMITARVEQKPTSKDSWACPKCGTYNPDTALFCKDCGEYK